MKLYKKNHFGSYLCFAMSNVALAVEFAATGAAYQFTDESSSTAPGGNQWTKYNN